MIWIKKFYRWSLLKMSKEFSPYLITIHCIIFVICFRGVCMCVLCTIISWQSLLMARNANIQIRCNAIDHWLLMVPNKSKEFRSFNNLNIWILYCEIIVMNEWMIGKTDIENEYRMYFFLFCFEAVDIYRTKVIEKSYCIPNWK